MTPKTLGRYEIVGELGKGAMGVVYLARDPLIGRRLALKTFRLDYGAAAELEQFRQRFLREAQSAGILNHPGIVTIHDVVDEAEAGIVFIAMEYVEGTDLKQLLRRRERLPLSFAVDIATQLAEALDYAHAAGVVHRDIKPANIIITKAGRAKITDFGIARIDASNLTVEGQLLGTPNYMAPEQIQGLEVDHRADLFSLGVLMYEMVTGLKPFSGENLTVVTHRIVHEPFTPPQETIEGLPSGIVAVLEKCLSKSRAGRYQRANELASDLKHLDQVKKKAPQGSSVSFLEQTDATLPVAEPAAPEAGAFDQGAVPADAVGAEVASGAFAASVADVEAPDTTREVDGAIPAPASTQAPTPALNPALTPVPTPASTPASDSSPTVVVPASSVAEPATPPAPAMADPGRKRLLIGAIAATVVAGLLLALALGVFSGRAGGDGAAESSWRAAYVDGLRLLENGDYAAAIEALDRALESGKATPEVQFARDRAARAFDLESASSSQEFVVTLGADEEPDAAVTRLLDTAEAALAARAYDQVLVLVGQVLEIEPGSRSARRLANEANEGLARRARATERLGGTGVDSRPGQTAPTGPSASSPAPRVSPPRSTARRPPPPSRTPPAVPGSNRAPGSNPASGSSSASGSSPTSTGGLRNGTLIVALESQIPEGILTIYRGQKRLYRKSFRFEGRGTTGAKEDRIEVAPGALALKVYLWRKGASTRTVEIDGSMPNGGTEVLGVRVDAQGGVRVDWRSPSR